jgi:hypothetical protein
LIYGTTSKTSLFIDHSQLPLYYMTQQDPWILPPKLVMLPSGYLLRLTFILWPHPSLLASSRVIPSSSLSQTRSFSKLPQKFFKKHKSKCLKTGSVQKEQWQSSFLFPKNKKVFFSLLSFLLPSHCFISVQALALRSSTRTASLVWPLFLVPKSRVRAREHVGPNSFTDGDPLKATTMSPYSFLLLVIKNSTFFQFSA